MSVLVAVLGCTRAPPADSGSTRTEPEIPSVTFSAVGFNVESGDADQALMADEVVAPIRGEAIWGFAEVEDETAARRLVEAAEDPDSGQHFRYVFGSTGFEDRLVLAWDGEQFELESSEELVDINVGGTARAPLVGRLRERETDLALTVVVNHLWRTDDDARLQQAEMLNRWGRDQEGPVLMIGDYNLDWQVDSGARDGAFDVLVDGGVFRWVRPDPMIRTQCSNAFNSILDFSFVGGEALDWDGSAEVLRADPEYCREDPEDYADHRPVRVTLTTP